MLSPEPISPLDLFSLDIAAIAFFPGDNWWGATKKRKISQFPHMPLVLDWTLGAEIQMS